MYIQKSKTYKPNTGILQQILEEGEQALAFLQIGFNSKVLTTKRLIFLNTSEDKVKESVNFDDIQEFLFSSKMGAPSLEALMKDGSKQKIGSLDKSVEAEVKEIFINSLKGVFRIEEDVNDEPAADSSTSATSAEKASPVRTNSNREFPKWLKKSIENAKSENEDLLMVITEPDVNHQGALLVFGNRCVLAKGGLVGGFMAGSLGGERSATFFFSQITGIEYNSGMINGVLEILTPSYDGSRNKDFWQGVTSSRNANSDDPWTLSNTLPLTKNGYKTAKGMIDELRLMVAEAHQPKAVKVESAPSMAGELGELSKLYESGLLTDEEFLAAKRKILGN